MNLFEKQRVFSVKVAELILQATKMGYYVTLGEAWRPDAMAKINADKGIGIDNSLHKIRLAIDINLFLDGKFLVFSKDYKKLGDWWEAQSTTQHQCCWGGRFNDGNHFSISHNGVK